MIRESLTDFHIMNIKVLEIDKYLPSDFVRNVLVVEFCYILFSFYYNLSFIFNPQGTENN